MCVICHMSPQQLHLPLRELIHGLVSSSSSIQCVCQEPPEVDRKEKQQKNERNFKTTDQKANKYSQTARYKSLKCKTELRGCQTVKEGIISEYFSPPGDC